MGRWLRVVTAVVPVAVFLVLAQGTAYATEVVEDDLVTDLADLENGGVTTRECPDYPSGYEPEHQDVTYRSVSSKQLKLDVYEPLSTHTGDIGVIVVVHGGGWFTGCKRMSATFAQDAARGVSPSPGFLVFNLDYRLACTSADDPEIDYYCGWTFATPADDVEYAIAWARAHAPDYLGTGQTFSEKVAVFGSSAGGNLAFEAGMHGSSTKRPDAVAGLVRDPGPGGRERRSVLRRLLRDRLLPARGPELRGRLRIATCPTTWDQASPDYWIDGSDPATFIANATEELSPPDAATEFHTDLAAAEVTNDICWVDSDETHHPHGLGLRDWDCNDDDGTWWSWTTDWLDTHTQAD